MKNINTPGITWSMVLPLVYALVQWIGGDALVSAVISWACVAAGASTLVWIGLVNEAAKQHDVPVSTQGPDDMPGSRSGNWTRSGKIGIKRILKAAL